MISVPKTISDGSLACFFHPTRLRIIKLLKEEGGLSISEIASKLDLNRLAVCHHLGIMEASGLIKREYQIIDPPTNHRRGRFRQCFSITDKVTQVITDTREFLNNLEEALKEG